MESDTNGLATVNADPGTLVAGGISSKTPVSLLQEMAAKRGITPKYDLLQVEGAVHEPTFLYRATVGEFVASGQGQSKKKAKHTAARAVLDQLIGNQKNGSGVSPLRPADGSPAEQAPQQLVPPYDDGIPGNPVGQLQELCMSRRWPPPTYELVHEQGLPHERTFTIACCIGNEAREIGSGKSKKIAKRQASSLMLTKLKDTSASDGANILDDDDEILQKMAAPFSGLRDSWQPKAASQSGVRISQFHRVLKASVGQLITQLPHMQITDAFSCIQHLQEIAQEQNFDVTWVDIDEKTTEGRYHCLVQLSTHPVAVCYGTGDDPALAKMDTARNALEYLKTVVTP